MGKAKILVIDDDLDITRFVKRILKRKDYEVIEAQTGEEGLAKAFESQPDIVITDINLPHINGYYLISRLKKDPQTAHIPIIAMSGDIIETQREMLFEAGCDSYIPKELFLGPDELPLHIERVLHGRVWE